MCICRSKWTDGSVGMTAGFGCVVDSGCLVHLINHAKGSLFSFSDCYRAFQCRCCGYFGHVHVNATWMREEYLDCSDDGLSSYPVICHLLDGVYYAYCYRASHASPVGSWIVESLVISIPNAKV